MEAAPLVDIRLFGPLSVLVADQPLPRLRSRTTYWLLALLALRQNREVSREWLAATLWPDSDTTLAYYNLRRCLTNLRQALGAAADCLLSPTSQSLCLSLSGVFVDAMAFDEAIARGDSASLEQAVALYEGPLLEGCPEEWVTVERATREQSYLAALERLAERARTQGSISEAVRLLRLLIAADPLREENHCALMQLCAESGDFAAAMQVYRGLRQRLQQEHIAAPAPETDALYQRIRTHSWQPSPLAVPPPALPASLKRRLPVPLTSLVGREQQVEQITEWLQRERLITLLGTGGIGKTRLSVAVGEAMKDAFPDGVWFVELASLSAPELVTQTVATALGLPEQNSRSALETLQEHLSARSLLLILDNCEHLLDSCAHLANDLLTACPGIHLLATSRHPLGIVGELGYRVPSLEVPTEARASENKDIASLMEYSGLRLFVERARLMKQNFRLTRENVETVCRICHHLDGIPLAIELAAACVRNLSLSDIHRKLDQRFRLLTGGSRTALPRQQTLRSLIDWSYELLDEPEKALLCRLSVFAGGWTLEAAEAVCAGDRVEDWEALNLLASLCDKSLVLADPLEHGTRYSLLETVRQYAQDRLQENGEVAAWKDRHLAYFLALAEEAEPHLTGAEQQEWFARLETEHDNLRTVLEWSVDEPGNPAAGMRLAGALRRFWSVRGHMTEGRERLARVLTRDTGANPAIRARVLHEAGTLAWQQTDYGAAQALHEESLSLWREVGERAGVAYALNNLGIVTLNQGDYETAWALHSESLALKRELGDRWGIAASLNNLSLVAHYRGDLATAQTLQEESLAISRELGDQGGVANLLGNLGNVLLDQSDCAAARKFQTESLIIRLELEDQWGIACSLEAMAAVHAASGERVQAARLWGAAEQLREKIGTPLSPNERRRHEAQVTVARSVPQEDATLFDAIWMKGRLLPLEQAIDLALRAAGPVQKL